MPPTGSSTKRPARRQQAAYEKLTELLTPLAGERYFGTLPGPHARRRARRNSPGSVQKRAQEIARYVLPVATFAYLYHTVSGITLFRYWRLCESFDAPPEQREVVGRMVEEVLRHDPLYRGRPRGPDSRSRRRPSTPRFRRAGVAAVRAGIPRGVRPRARRPRLAARRLEGEQRRDPGLRRARDPGRPAGRVSPTTRRSAWSLDPAKNRLLGETLTLTTHGKLSRALFHPSYTFRKKLSHTADSQDQRHRMTPASRPALPAYLSDEPDYVVADARRRRPRGRGALPRARWRRPGRRSASCARAACADEYAAYLLPNAVAIRFTESADLLNLHHKFAMRLCYNAQEEIWRASLDEALQIREVNPRIGPWLLPPCTLRHHAGVRPVCPEGDRFCGVVVWKKEVPDFVRSL